MTDPAASSSPDARGDNEPGRTLTPQEVIEVVTLAMQFARDGRTDELIGFVVHGLPVDVRDDAGNTLVMLAAYHGHPETVRALVAHGADVDLRNGRDQSPLAGALFKGEDEVVRILVESGADLDGGTPSARTTAVMFGVQHLLPTEQA